MEYFAGSDQYCKLKVLILTNRIPYPLNDGGNIATQRIIDLYKQLGYEVVMLALNPVKHYQNPAILNDLGKIITVDINTEVTPWGLIRGLIEKFPYNVKRFYSTDYAKKLAELLSENSFHIIQSEGPYMGMYLSSIRHNTNAIFMLRAHNIENEIWSRVRGKEKNFFKRWYLTKLTPKIAAYEEKILGIYDAILSISERDAHSFKKMNGKNIFVLPPSIDLHDYNVTKENRPLNWCFIGSLEWIPNLQGLEWFISAVWPDLSHNFPLLTLDIAGKNPPFWLSNLNIPGIRVIGEVPDASQFMNNYNVLVAPLLSGGGIRIKILEAMAMQMTVISTTIGAEGIPSTHRENILIADKVADYIQVAEDLSKGTTQTLKIGLAARLLISKYFEKAVILENFKRFLDQL